MRPKVYGFHLLELVLSLALIALLVQLASPHLRQPKEKAQHFNALSILLETQLKLESCYTHQRTYVDCKQTLLEKQQVHIEASTDQYEITVITEEGDAAWSINEKNELQTPHATPLYKVQRGTEDKVT